MNDTFYGVIMAGGGGTRLWPLSRKRSPKQLLKLVGGKSLFQIAVERLDGLLDYDHILVVTIASQVALLHEQVPEIPLKNYLIEPMPKGTAAVVGFAAAYLQKIDPDAIMAILTADHVMENVPYFQDLLTKAAHLARSKTLVTIGIKPEFASTGYGYIETGAQIESEDAFHVKQFVEKPNAEVAARYVESGNYYWNSGMFIWSVGVILEEIERQMPDLSAHLSQVKERITPGGRVEEIQDIWSTIRAQTIDYGIMEGAKNVSLIPAHDLGWKDLGSWDALFAILQPDERGNIEQAGRILNLNSKNNFIQSTDPDKVVAVIGVEDLIIIDHEDTLLVCKKGESEKVKQIVNQLNEDDLLKYL